MKYPLACGALIFSAGIFFADKIRLSPFWPGLSTAAFLLLAVLALEKKQLCLFFLSLSFFFLGGFALRNAYSLPPNHIARLIPYAAPEPCSIKGYINDEPLVKEGGSSFVLRSSELCRGPVCYKCRGDILVYSRQGKGLSYGQEVEAEGRPSRPFAFGSSPGRGFREYLYRQNIYLVMRPAAGGIRVISGGNRGYLLKKTALQAKEKIEGLLFKRMQALPAAVLDAMLLGEKRLLPHPVYDSMVETGTVHILVVSGFNVGVVAFVVSSLLKLAQLRRRLRILILAAFLLFYCLMTGATNPVLRATVMGEAFLFARLFKREAGIYNPLGLAALAILAFSPKQLFDPGFQLSFVSVFFIAYLYPKLKAFLRVEGIKVKLLRYFLEAILVSFSAWLGTALLVLYYFRLFSAVAIIANLFIVPLAGLITLCGFSLLLAGLLFPPLAASFACSSEFLILLLLKINSLLASLPFACIRLS